MTSEQNEHTLLKEKIEGWLEAEGIAFQEASDLNSFFRVQVSLKNVPIHVHESRVRRGVLVVQGVLELSDGQLLMIEKINHDEKKSLFLSLFALLDKSEYLFMLQEDFTSENWLRIQRTLYIEDLTRTRLLTEMKDLNTKFVNINYYVNESLGNITPIADVSNNESSMYS